MYNHHLFSISGKNVVLKLPHEEGVFKMADSN